MCCANVFSVIEIGRRDQVVIPVVKVLASSARSAPGDDFTEILHLFVAPIAHTPIFSRISFSALSVSFASASMTFSSSTISAMGR